MECFIEYDIDSPRWYEKILILYDFHCQRCDYQSYLLLLSYPLLPCPSLLPSPSLSFSPLPSPSLSFSSSLPYFLLPFLSLLPSPTFSFHLLLPFPPLPSPSLSYPPPTLSFHLLPSPIPPPPLSQLMPKIGKFVLIGFILKNVGVITYFILQPQKVHPETFA